MAPTASNGFKAGDRVRVAFGGGPTANGVLELLAAGNAPAKWTFPRIHESIPVE